jgi:predicted kinase
MKVAADSVPTLHFIAGKLASGKSTLAKDIAREHEAILISEDVWLSRLYPDVTFDLLTYLKLSAVLRATLAPHLVDLLLHGVSIVLDFAGNVPRDRAWVRSIFEAAKAPHILHYIIASDAVCKARLRQRNAALPDGAQHTTDEQFDIITAYFVPPDAAEGFSVREYPVVE